MDLKTTVTFHIDDKNHGLTIRQFLASFYISKSNIYKCGLYGNLNIFNQPASLEYILKKNDELTIDFKWYDKKAHAHAGKIEILYEDDDILAVLKPVQLLVHTDGNEKDTLTQRVQAYYEQKNYGLSVLPVQRLDLETSGIVLFAKHPLALSFLSYQLEHHNVNKTYEAIVRYHVKNESGTINQRIGRDRHSDKQIITKNGQDAITHYKVLGYEEKRTRLEVTIETGRKHQIRVHLLSIGHPIVGDILYGSRSSDRLMLHATKLVLIHPRTKDIIEIKSNPPF
ncbi:MAG: hypothetical protein CVV61_02135 [Tenericutes bacterium HGW-Tenericutes-6]|nr:MAG: hypothetical protein CVV61_02135 [Tenericutes bacterium HGW-Tenericutes-6]